MNNITVLDLWMQFKNQQGGTIHQATNEFKQLPTDQQLTFKQTLNSHNLNTHQTYIAQQFNIQESQ